MTSLNTAAVRDRFAAHPVILAAYALGSAVRGTLRPDSDVDFGVLPLSGQTLSAREINDLASDLTLLLGRPADIGLISGRNLIYARQCVLTGQTVFCRNVFQTGLAVATLLGLAFQLDFERKEILHAYTA